MLIDEIKYICYLGGRNIILNDSESTTIKQIIK